MRSSIVLLLIILSVSCQTTKIKNVKYRISPATTELGSIGQAKSIHGFTNDFSTRSFPVLENQIRLDIQVLPFNKKINEIYLSKSRNNQVKEKINYIDSLPKKPEFVTVSILDLTGFANELNAAYNKDITTYMKDIGNAAVITGIALTLSEENITKIRQADAYYLLNNQDKKYTIALYKEGKKTAIIDLRPHDVLAYTTGKFCWSVNDRQQWYISDIIRDNETCKGNTKSRIKEKEQTNLFKM